MPNGFPGGSPGINSVPSARADAEKEGDLQDRVIGPRKTHFEPMSKHASVFQAGI